jgi:hypothetical protein
MSDKESGGDKFLGVLIAIGIIGILIYVGILANNNGAFKGFKFLLPTIQTTIPGT